MTVPAIEPVVTYSGNGSATTFNFGFLINAESELSVQFTNSDGAQTDLVLNTDYSIHETGNSNGSYITFPLGTSTHSVLGTTEKITLSMVLSVNQEVPFGISTGLDFTVLERSFDYLTRIAQIQERKLERCVKVKEGSGVDPDNLIQSIDASVLASNSYASAALNSAIAATTSATNASASQASAADSAVAAANAVASVKMPAPVALNYLRQKSDLSGFENRTPDQVREDLNQPVIHLGVGGVITSNPTFSVDRQHDGFIKANINPSLPTISDEIPRNILFDFNIEPGRTFTMPSNVKWDYGSVPTFVAWPDCLLNIATINNMALSFPATSGQYVDLLNVPFNNVGSQPWEQIWNITPQQVGIAQYIQGSGLGVGKAPIIGITATNFLQLYLSSNAASYDIASNVVASTNALAINTNYFIKLVFTGAQYVLSISTDGIVYTPVITVTSTIPIYTPVSGNVIRLGAHIENPTTMLFKGTIDLNKSSIKINGGRNLLTPEPGVYLNRIIYDTQDGLHYKAHYSQVAV